MSIKLLTASPKQHKPGGLIEVRTCTDSVCLEGPPTSLRRLPALLVLKGWDDPGLEGVWRHELHERRPASRFGTRRPHDLGTVVAVFGFTPSPDTRGDQGLQHVWDTAGRDPDCLAPREMKSQPDGRNGSMNQSSGARTHSIFSQSPGPANVTALNTPRRLTCPH